MGRTLVSMYWWTFTFFNFTLILLLVSIVHVITKPFDRTQKISNYIMLAFGHRLVSAWPGWRVKRIGFDKLEKNKPKIIISNHQSFMDMPLQASLPLNFKWVSKAEMFSIPIMGWFMTLTKQLSVIRGKSSAFDLFKQAEPYFKRGTSICLFPEGTRTRDGKLKPFKKGAFVLSKESNLPIQPVVINGTFNLNQPGDWRFAYQCQIEIHVLDEVNPEDFSDYDEMKDYCHNLYIEKLNQLDAE